MTKNIILICLLLSSIGLFANDGAFYFRGNQLIPIAETDITVRKEILTLKKIRNQFIEVTVYYEFYNPGSQKEMIVGFEAFSPEGDVDGTPKNGNHPYMRDFTVELNNEILSYKVAYVSDSVYVQNGVINGSDLVDFENPLDFFYVYHFNAVFKEGLNRIKHTYNYEVSEAVGYAYDFEYILTAANRWGNKQIDDFTLIVDNGEFETFNINKSFFTNNSDWIINGIGKVEDKRIYNFETAQFNIQKGNIIFQKKNFKPQGELFVFAARIFNEDKYIPFSYYAQDRIFEPSSDFEKKALRNLPFARRGYIFKNSELQAFFEMYTWYIPNPNYQPDVSILTDIEKAWLKKFEE